MGKRFDGVRAASSSSIEIDFYYAGKRRRERVRLKPTPANLKRAANHRAAILDAIERGTFDYASTFPHSKFAKDGHLVNRELRSTLADYLLDWLDDKSQSVKSSTLRDYTTIAKGALIPHLGEIALPDLRRSDLKSMCDKLQCSNKRIANILSMLRTALTSAVTNDLIEQNPLAGWTYARSEPPREDDYVDPFTQDEQERILAALPPQGRNLVLFALWTGLRTSELVALRWTDVDFERGEIQIRRAITQSSKKAESTKTKRGVRTIKLLTPARCALDSQREHTMLYGAEIFHNPRTGAPWTGDQPIRKTLWQPALRRAKVRYRVPYQTRHTYASMMLSAGEHPMWVAQQMGHADWAMIRRVYGRWMPDAAPDAGSRAEAIFSKDGQSLVSKSAAGRANTG